MQLVTQNFEATLEVNKDALCLAENPDATLKVKKEIVQPVTQNFEATLEVNKDALCLA